jgi:enoyl-CoA hydratase/carnithine racemase
VSAIVNDTGIANMPMEPGSPAMEEKFHQETLFASDRFVFMSEVLAINYMESLAALVITKNRAGFDRGCIDDIARLLLAISSGEIRGLKYLVFDFAHRLEGQASAAAGFDDLITANAELILFAPVITIAWARALLAGADLEFASHCSMLVAEKDARFSFDGDPQDLLGLYSALAAKIGFAKTQRLIENGDVLGANDMRDLLLAKDVVEPKEGLGAIGGYVGQCGRRYNATYSIFRAQRSVMRSIGRPAQMRARA